MTDPGLIWIAYCRRVLGQLTDDELADEVERLRYGQTELPMPVPNEEKK